MTKLNFYFPKIGPIFEANVALGDLTILTGKNNTGKTYITHTIYAALKEITSPATEVDFRVPEECFRELRDNSYFAIEMDSLTEQVAVYLEEFSRDFSGRISEVFAAEPNQFSDSSVEISVEDYSTSEIRTFSATVGYGDKRALRFEVSEDGSRLEIYALDNFPSNNQTTVLGWVRYAARLTFFSSLISNVYVSSAERTGAAIFQKELDFTRSKILEMVANKSAEIDQWSFVKANASDYPDAVTANVDFIRDIPSLSSKVSAIAKASPEAISIFEEILGGEYNVKEGEISFSPEGMRGKKSRLPIVTSSSAVRSLLDLWFYVKHKAKPDDFVIIDEPELNLHPENQRRLARLLVALSNAGLKIFITTHSDYIVREISIMIMVNARGITELPGTEGPVISLDARGVEVYSTGERRITIPERKNRVIRNTVFPITVDKYGIDATSFDEAIDAQNDLFDAVSSIQMKER